MAPPAPDPADIDHDFAAWTDPQSARDRRFLMARELGQIWLGSLIAGHSGAPPDGSKPCSPPTPR